jgi:hypothetical protein
MVWRSSLVWTLRSVLFGTSVSIFFASGWMDLGRASRMLADLCAL